MVDNISEKTLALRKQIFIRGYKGGMAHLASCFSCVEILYALYSDVLKYDAKNAKSDSRDRLILSKGHAGLALYAVLLEHGLITKETFDSYLQENALIGGEPCMRDCDRIEATTGSLGHGLSMGLGMALAYKQDEKGNRVFVILGDGECEEGTVWEAAMSASAFHLDNLTAILDCNDIQKMDFVNKTIGEPLWREKWQSFGWDVQEVDGHDVKALSQLLAKPNNSGKPRLVIAHTVKGKGVSIMENNPNWHFKLPNKKELKVFLEELNVGESELR